MAVARINQIDEEIAKWSDPYWLDDDHGHRQYDLDGNLLEAKLVKVYPEPAHRPPRARRAPKGQQPLPFHATLAANDRPEPATAPPWPGALPAPVCERYESYHAGAGRYVVVDRLTGRDLNESTEVGATEAEGDMLAARLESEWMGLRAVFLRCSYRAVRAWYCERMAITGVPLEMPELARWSLDPPSVGPLPPAMPSVARIGRRADPSLQEALEIKERASTKLREVQQYQLRLAALWLEANHPLDARVPIERVEALQWVIGHHDPAWWARRGIDMIDPEPHPLHAQRVYCQRAIIEFNMLAGTRLPR